MKNNKALGQHWLNNRVILNEIADLACHGVKTDVDVGGAERCSSKKDKLCVEIGPGLGTLTSSLLKRFDKVVAIEFDKRLADNLPKSFPGKNLEVINGDFLETDLGFIEGDFVIVGNIPYYITSPIIRKVLTLDRPAKRVVLLVQKEVAERLADKKETMLSLFVKNRADVKLGPVVKKEEFVPPPKVDSQVVVFEPHEPTVGEEVFDLVQRGFMAPRKKLVHNLAGIVSNEKLLKILSESGIDANARPGDLRLKEWEKIYNELKVN